MTEYELVELSMAGLANLGAAAMYFVTIVFAYLVAAYAVGAKLSKWTAWCFSALYSAALIFPYQGIQVGFYRYNRSVEEYLLHYPDGMAFAGATGAISATTYYLSVAPLALAWLASLVYMHAHVRRLAGKRGHTEGES